MSLFRNKESGAKKIDSKTAKEMMDNKKVVVVDVRTPGEYASGYIKNAILLPLADISFNASKILPDKETQILVYCLSGARSRSATKLLSRAGYSNVYDFGGINGWKYGIVKG